MAIFNGYVTAMSQISRGYVRCVRLYLILKVLTYLSTVHVLRSVSRDHCILLRAMAQVGALAAAIAVVEDHGFKSTGMWVQIVLQSTQECHGRENQEFFWS